MSINQSWWPTVVVGARSGHRHARRHLAWARRCGASRSQGGGSALMAVSIRNLSCRLQPAQRHRACAARYLPRYSEGRDARAGRRIRLRQIHRRLRVDGPACQQCQGDVGHADIEGQKLRSDAGRDATACLARPRHGDDLSGSDAVAQSGFHHRPRILCEVLRRRHPESDRKTRARDGRGRARQGQAQQPRAAHEAISA